MRISRFFGLPNCLGPAAAFDAPEAVLSFCDGAGAGASFSAVRNSSKKGELIILF